MPWEPKDASSHNKKAKGKKARQWAHVADSEMASGKDEGTAIRIANGVIKKKSAFDVLMDLAKGIGNDLVSNTTVNVRPYERKMRSRQNAFTVKPQRKVRLDTKSMEGGEEDE